ncbi:MAG: MBL fold metallo-hydrolase [Prevotellaceae bacterium]|nr:MBL fold metallo-hydrolase [Prevotellaceae bacterium]
MKITFLGTGTSQGVPVIGCRCEVCKSLDERDKRLRSSALIEIEGRNILIDAGPDFRQQLLRAGVSNLDAILLTHEHKDHIGGLDDVRALNYISGCPVDIYAENRTLKAVRAEYSYAFEKNPYPGTPEMNLLEISCNEDFAVGKINIVPIRALHCRLPVIGYRIDNFVYITDANSIDKTEMNKMKNCDVLVINALRKTTHLSHFTLAQALEIARTVEAKQTYFTHISHQMGLHAAEEKHLPANARFAYDGLIVEI